MSLDFPQCFCIYCEASLRSAPVTTEKPLLYAGYLICVNVALLPDVIVVDLLYIINSNQLMLRTSC